MTVVSRLAPLLVVAFATPLSAQAPVPTKIDEDKRYDGGVAFFVGKGWSFEEQTYNVFRLGLQLSSTSRAKRPVEGTGELQLLAATYGDGGAAVFYAGAGANLIFDNGAYAGPAFGFVLGDGAMPALGARIGLRPRRPGLRPELRADYIIDDSKALVLTLSLGLDVH